jgi:single-strand DNA-binding protein
MSDLNTFCATGRLTRDPEVRFLAGEKCVAGFAIAISHTYTKDSAKHEETIFLDCEAWGRLGEVIGQYCVKGKQIAVSGRLKQDTWEDKNGGGKRSKIKLVVNDMTLIGSKSEPAGGGAPAQTPQRSVPSRAAADAEADGGRFGGEDDPPF